MNFPNNNYLMQNFSEISQIRDKEKIVLKKISMGHFWICVIMFATQFAAQAFFAFTFGINSLSFLLLIATVVADLACYQFFVRKINYPVKDMLRPKFHNLDKYLKPELLLMFFVLSSGLNVLGTYIGIALGGISDIAFQSYFSSTTGFFYAGKYDIFFIISALVVAPIMEEIIFRGAILKPLRRYGDWFAILISSILFSLAHASLYQIPPTFFLGLLFGYITVKSNSILPGIILHFLNNFFVILEAFFSSFIFRTLDMVFVIATIVLLILFFRKRGGRANLFENIDAVPAHFHPQKKVLVYFTPFIIAAVIFIVLLSIIFAVFMFMYSLDILNFFVEFWRNF